MTDILWALLVRDLWNPIWPNLAASVIWAPGAFWWHHTRIKRHVSDVIAEIAARPRGDNR